MNNFQLLVCSRSASRFPVSLFLSRHLHLHISNGILSNQPSVVVAKFCTFYQLLILGFAITDIRVLLSLSQPCKFNLVTKKTRLLPLII